MRDRKFRAGAVLWLLLAASPVQAQDVTHSLRGSLPGQGSIHDIRPDRDLFRRVADAYRNAGLSAGDALAARLSDPDERTAAEWIALRTAQRSPGFERLRRFLAAHSTFPMRGWLRRKAEDALLIERVQPAAALAFFADGPPESINGQAALAHALLAAGRHAEAERAALAAYRTKGLTRDVADRLVETFPKVVDRDERILRAHRLILAGRVGEGSRIAAGFGPGHAALAAALAHADDGGRSESVLEKVPLELRAHSSFILARAQVLRRLGRLADARDLMFEAPRAGARLADGDAWWIERRMLARKLLAAGDHAGAYRIAAEHAAQSPNLRADAEFHAGWIALRRLQYAQTAHIHFRASSDVAVAANWRSRAAYWRGRAIEAGALGEAAQAFAEAAALPLTFYGQLALARRGDMAIAVPSTEPDADTRERFDNHIAGRVIDLLMSASLDSFAQPLAIDLARTERDAAVIAAAAEPFLARGDAVTVAAIGRVAVDRGLPLARLSHPTFGIPAFKPLPGSGARDIVYAIAHQESAFRADAVSTANARGLMQMLPSTAARTAQRFNVPFSPALLTAEPAISAMLGAAHVGELLEETRGALPLVFAAYNAGGGRVREWIEANGDPRRAEVDAVDWIEMIPIAETRHYVQKVMANLQVYRARFAGDHAALHLSDDLASGRR
jgi:soluble lytic murein transglycosylase